MSEFAEVSTAVRVGLSVANLMPIVTDEELGLSVAQLNHLLSFARSSSVHTRPTQTSEKANKKLAERVTSFNTVHMNTFLRCYMFGGAPISSSAVAEVMYMCICNDAEWVNKCQQLSLKALGSALDDRQNGRHSTPAADEPVGMAQLRASLPVLTSPQIPQFTSSCTHFKFIVDTSSAGCDDGKDRFFSAQVKIKNESKSPFSITVGQRVTLSDTQDRESVDFQILLDKQVVKKGESAVLLLSLIAKSYAVFNTIQEVVILHIEEGIKVVVTFVVVNPSVPFFGCGFPSCIPQKVVDTPLAQSYEAPLFLQMVKHLFITKGGFGHKDVSHLLQGIAHLYGAHNREVLREATRLKERLEEECTQSDLLSSFWTAGAFHGSTSSSSGKDSAGSGGSGASSGVGGSPSMSSVTVSKAIPCSLSQPSGFSPGGIAPTSAPSSSSFQYFPNASTQYPSCLLSASPSILFALVLLWFSEFPVPIVEHSILTCDPQTYLETMQPNLQGLVLWIVDFCLGFLVRRQENGTNVRSLALSFASMICPSAHLNPRRSHFPLGDTASEVLPAPPGSSDGGGEMERIVMLRMHVVTALVHWISTFEHIFAKHASR